MYIISYYIVYKYYYIIVNSNNKYLVNEESLATVVIQLMWNISIYKKWLKSYNWVI